MSTALYRRYRPETFADVIGQEHVTEPLITALENDRVNHAYLFSGPRGCGKTTSARILARCLNCAHGPTATPCGTCDSCRELSRDGGGSLDVIEMDAASHGGVDHARDLRERATFAPVRDRYKIFIIDEAHMVTREGFNALLKIVEEPPEHIKFIFATTEPNKVLGTIRSRTHHYPFRLVPPETLLDYMQKLCDEEGVQVENGVLQLVVRAGGGSVRDSLSILDQLMAGSDDAGITYDLAVALLGFTHGGLLDDVLSSFASGNAAEVFASVDRVIQTGQDPRRFVEDLLERFRDLIIVQAAPDSAQAILRGLSADQLSRLREQAASFGGAELSRAADITNAALNEMSGATSPQLHLELLCARILLPVSDKTLGGLGARLDRLERRVTSGQVASSSVQGQLQDARPARSAPSAMPAASEQASSEASSEGNQNTGVDQNPAGLAEKSAPLANLRRQQTTGSTQTPAQAAAGRGVQHEKQAESQPAQTTEQPQQNSDSDQASKPQKPEKTQVSEQPQVSEQAQPSSAQQAPQGQNTVLMVRNAWHDVLSRVQSPPARTWFGSCEPSKFEQGALYIRADIGTLRRVKDYIPQLKSALNEVLQLNVEIHAEVAKPGQSGQASLAGSSQSNPSQIGSSQQAQTPQQNQAPQAHPSQQAQTPQPASSGPNAQASNPADVQQVPLADGPRGGEEAWRTHGQPRTNEAPQWSTEDWNNPVTDWAVASIPSGEADNESAEDQTENQSVSQDSAHESNPAPKNSSASQTASAPLSEAPSPHPQEPAPETAPQLRVIKGEAPENPSPEDQARENHPSSGRWRRPEISAAPDPERSQNEDEEANVPDDYTPTTGIADGSVEPANAEDSVIPDPEPEAEAPEQPPVPAPAPLAERVQQSERQQQGQGSRFRERFAAQLEAGHRASEQAAQRSQPNSFDEPEDFTASDDDETLEASVLIGQRAVEKVLGGVVIEEQQLGQ